MAIQRVCSRCVMDGSDPDITFDSEGVCNHCRTYAVETFKRVNSRPGDLSTLIQRIRASGRGKDYDCILGVSGGVDSAYACLLAKDYGLRPLAVHLDNGWNSRAATSNIENLLRSMKTDLHTHVIDWEEFRDLQLSFLHASVPDAEIPTDHAIFALLHHIAARQRIRYVITGYNASTEAVLPRAWSHGHYDWRYISKIHRRFGSHPLSTFPYASLFRLYRWTFLHRIQFINILDSVPYHRAAALQRLKDTFDWNDYDGKHGESIYTRFYQNYFLPAKFGFDKRKAHLSALILSGQMDREDALARLAHPPYDESSIRGEMRYLLKKLHLDEDGFRSILAAPARRFSDFPSYERDHPYRPLFWFIRRVPRLRGYLRWRFSRLGAL